MPARCFQGCGSICARSGPLEFARQALRVCVDALPQCRALPALSGGLGAAAAAVPGAVGGPADALNKALPAARGSLIGLLNADNLYPPGALDRAVAANDHEAAAADLSRDPAVLAAYRQRFSWAAAGARYRARLEELRGQRQVLAERLK